MVRVLITIDTEVYPLLPNWREDWLEGDVARDVYGQTRVGEFGLRYQLHTFRKYDLKAIFFVESLFADAVGIRRLHDIIQEIRELEQEVQLHLHPEWLAWTKHPCVEPKGRETIDLYSQVEQTQLLARGLANLRAAGAKGVCAFRAGDYAASLATLRALRDNDVKFDTSLNFNYPISLHDLGARRSATQPLDIEGICEVPVTYWHTPPRGRRHAQLVSASISELKAALWHAHENQWKTFVIVSHSFELLAKRRQRPANPNADPVVVRRFIRLCEFLDKHRDKFQTCGFNDLEICEHLLQKPALKSPLHRTVSRNVEQLYRRLA